MGTGVFDGLMAYWNDGFYRLHEAEAHFDRLLTGAHHMGMPVTHSTAELIAAVKELLASVPNQTYYIRPIVFRGGAELWLTGAEGRPVDIAIFGVPAPRGDTTPIDCELSEIERVSSRAMPVAWKVCGLYVNSFLARRNAEKSGSKDGLMLDREGRIAEASAANVFFVSDGSLVTPPLNPDVFPGITRRVVMEMAAQERIDVEERNIWPDELSNTQGAFLCSTLMELKPISSIGLKKFSNSGRHPVFEKIQTAFHQLTQKAEA